MDTFLKYDTMQSTNNTAERALRPIVVHRKVKGKLNNAEGMKKFGILLTFHETMRKRGLNPVEEIKRLIVRSCVGLA